MPSGNRKGTRNRRPARSPSDATPNSSPEDGRGRDPNPNGGSGSPVLEILVVFLAVYLLQGVAAFAGAMGGLFVLAPPLTDNPWTIVTSVYAHGGMGHLLSNSVALLLFGWPIARATSRLRFHLFFAITGALAGISQILLTDAVLASPLVAATGRPGVLGASGAVFALMGYLIASNRLSAGLASFVDVPRWVAITVFVVLAAAVTLATASPGVALVAHFAGFLLGLFAGRARVLHVGRQPRY
ncbi:rhomboid family intramembrane serine protease [Halobiforma lacisalsi AJ5]|uniref:Rhomboid family intramembrane serine protease n=1 Tax=Natronobacterium lacisalsi AJ5 TaxID=358396 RepID=M0LQU4_NATLA|nr:rhomboid family intramembrane serine protease [Halobiforma lacisalsi]APW99948.1 rhomboid family intramembrane serine protease [Halobiforma lacisalsi AJ5]EMA35861.1 rhomboid family protein [Halobiforma lacisalsi AJ5]